MDRSGGGIEVLGDWGSRGLGGMERVRCGVVGLVLVWGRSSGWGWKWEFGEGVLGWERKWR